MRRGVITFVFDDGYEAIYQHVPDLLESRGWRGVFAVPLDAGAVERTERRPVRPWGDWLRLKERGHELAGHSVNHVDLTKIADEQLSYELREPATALGASTVVYPGGACDDRVVSMAKNFYTAGRTAKKGLERLPPANPLQLRTYNFTRDNFSVTKANLLALWAGLSNRWLIETYHLVDDAEQEMVHSVKRSDLMRHLAFISWLPIHIKTIHEVISDSHYQK